MNISELISELQNIIKTSGDLPVVVTWEGRKNDLDRDCLHVESGVLMIDGESGEWIKDKKPC